MDTGREVPANRGGFNRFPPGFESVALRLNLCHRGDHIRREVDGDLSRQFDQEPRTFIEKSGDALSWCAHVWIVVAGAGVEPAQVRV